MQAVGRIDEDGSRYLLGDFQGRLYMLALTHDGTSVLELQLEPLGRITPPATLTYLDNRVVFVGCTCGDSQLIRLHATPLTEAEPDEFVEVLDSYLNLGPIVDFAVVDLERQGQGQVRIHLRWNGQKDNDMCISVTAASCVHLLMQAHLDACF